MRISDWSSDVCSSDLRCPQESEKGHGRGTRDGGRGSEDRRHRPAAPLQAAGASGRAAPHGEVGVNRAPGGDADSWLVDRIALAAEPLPDPGEPAFGPAFDRLGAARLVLLGEATHGTSEFYRARAAITRRLIERHGFTIVAVEADWPDAARADSYVRHAARPPFPTPAFARFPRWRWRNREVADFVDWLWDWNGRLGDPADRTGFRGLDLYSLNTSIRAVLDYLDRTDPEAARTARERYGSLMPWARDPADYGRVALGPGLERCERAGLATLRHLLVSRSEYTRRHRAGYFEAAQNPRPVPKSDRRYPA